MRVGSWSKCIIFTMDPILFIFFVGGGGRGEEKRGGVRVSDFFYKESKSKKKLFAGWG